MPRNAPRPGRGIDHLVLCVRNLDAAAEMYERLGFTLTPRASHDWGTDNRLVQVEGSFLEIIEVAHPDKLLPERDGAFGFGNFIHRYLQNREGFGMLVFESGDAEADRKEFAENGLSNFERFDFERKATLPDGSTVTVGFSLSFVHRPECPDAAFFVCQQHAPEYFWKPHFQKHRNGARAIGEVVLIADNPGDLQFLFEGLQQPESVALEDGILRAETARGWMSAMTPEAYRDWFGSIALDKVDAPKGPHLAAFRVLVDNLAETEKLLGEAGVAAHWAKAGLVVPAPSLFGVTLAFVQAVEQETASGPMLALPSA
ncbi:VOC family protein [Hwanghaeella grinnelliae]|uniref:VOC family protein n=1 Tax=Hwanghaeella grinnelliae TaxID=2500179 RepID=A0A3S2WAI6_9PROT|nr:VOC family protein [Hwanghaeella grinnelliae]RVU37945.1 VOC family protein [Hwanghaeella grinnelliae]